MESAAANIHHQHQPQDQHVVASTTNPYAYAATTSTTNNPFLNTSSLNACSEVGIFNSRDSWQKNDQMPLSSSSPSVNSSIIRGLGFHWANLNHETSESSCSKLTQALNSSSSSSSSSQQIGETYTSNMIKNLQKDPLIDLLNPSTVLKDHSTETKTGYRMNEFEMCPEESNSNYFNQMSSLVNYSSSLDMMNTLQASNFLSSARFNEGFSQIPRDQLGFFRDGVSYGLDYHMPQPSFLRPIISNPSNITSLSNVVAEAKRSFMMLESKASVPAEPVPKKSRLVSRASCPPFKVRKEKLGDRIAALQQLVAPFGKTDTASVLMEAIGYIKFLQNQVETLSVPYMKSSHNKPTMMQGGTGGNESEEAKQDLRSRGLCLVPLSCLSYVADGGGGVWPPPTFGGGV